MNHFKEKIQLTMRDVVKSNLVHTLQDLELPDPFLYDHYKGTHKLRDREVVLISFHFDGISDIGCFIFTTTRSRLVLAPDTTLTHDIHTQAGMDRAVSALQLLAISA